MKKGNLSLYFSLIVLGILVFVAIFAPWISPYDPNAQNLSIRLMPPFQPGHVLGTDYLGRDIFSRLLYGATVSIKIGIIGTVLGLCVGVFLGSISGYYGGVIDSVIMRFGDVQLAFPFLLLAIALIGVFGTGVNNIIIVAVITGWIKYARVIRSSILAEKEKEYVQAGIALGFTDYMQLKHIIPNVIPAAIVLATLETGRIILMESTLSFLGMGVPSNLPAWGSMLADGRTYMMTQPWIAIFPGLAIFLLILSVNLFGDWVRVKLDPKM